MSVISAYVMPHPPLAVPAVGSGKESIIKETVLAMDEIGREIAYNQPDTIIFITPHGTVFGDYFHVSPGEEAEGNFSRFGVEGVNFSVKYDTDLVEEVCRVANEKSFSAGKYGEHDPALDHGVTVPMYYINRHYKNYKTVRVSQARLYGSAHFTMGEILAKAADSLARRVVIIASGDLSHKLSESGPYGFAPEGEIFDREIMKNLSEENFGAILSMDAELLEKAAECGYRSFAMLAGCLSKTNFRAKQLSYECPFGVGYGVVSFAIEDAYCALARRSLEYRVKTGKDMPLDEQENISCEMLSRQAGAFVSLHKGGQLRGCIGTIAPSTESIAEEIIQNAVSAGLYDSRFPPVDKSELPHLTYKVDILEEPEDIPGPEALDVKKYGVIVESGYKRGLLLPNLDGINSVQRQVDIACQKAEISPYEPFKLKRFKVTRYE